ncbi:GNAT family N-acetyltransferase [Saccharomonospora saliphila]|uniref:GNAT family N-acetyltransferase n=1 Tax=Saccharomonospora saliphila TaxID=369829 RepID=UPI0003626728|nr:GNAT family N-acetyltransferase [Saccharomonospora saliphila]
MDTETVTTEHAKRLSTLDPLLAPPAAWDGESGTRLRVPDGAALATRSVVDPDSEAALWRPLCEYRLDVRLAGDDPGAALHALLDRWETLLADGHGTGRQGPEGTGGTDGYDTDELDTAAVLTRPSRDGAGTDALLRHGFAPVRVLAVRPAARHTGGPPAVPGVRIRHAVPADLDTAVRLQLELRQYDTGFGATAFRPGARDLITERTRELLARDTPVPSLWIAELYGTPLGLVHIQLPPESDWIAGAVASDRVGYLPSLNIAEASRGTGVGTALADHAHQLFTEAGVDVVLLHHALANPRSTPFWYAQGYRPLWTSWYRTPAR